MFTIAVAGKGGMGKTTVAAAIIESMRRKGKRPILAVDADPNSTLGDWLGIKCSCAVADIIEETKGLRNLPEGVSKPAHLEFQIQRTLVESKGVDLLVMGRPEGPDCYCMANNMLRGYITELAESYPYVVLDNEAGMEHLNRKTTQDIDALLLVSDPTRIGLRTTKNIKELIDKLTFLRIKKKYLILNKSEEPRESKEFLESYVKGIELELIGLVPVEKELQKLELEGKPISALADTSPFMKAVGEIVERILN
ncbi:MAG: AAA family ATPase [Planctomycetes bacterium]|nr:AAA family ATPase [Planctomycetota bacterium]